MVRNWHSSSVSTLRVVVVVGHDAVVEMNRHGDDHNLEYTGQAMQLYDVARDIAAVAGVTN